MSTLHSNWQIFVENSYLSKEPSDQQGLFEQVILSENEFSNDPLQSEAFTAAVDAGCSTQAQRLILFSAPWRTICRKSWRKLMQWLDQDYLRRLIFLENRPTDLALALKDQGQLGLFSQPQISIHYCSGIHGEVALQLLASELAHHPCDLHVLSRQSEWKLFSQELLAQAGLIRGVGDELLRSPHTALFCVRNGPFQAKDVDLLNLKGALSGLPAILCGAGPSLTQQLNHIAKCRDTALIIGCGSGALALQKAQISPHAVATICPLRASFERWHQLDTFTKPALTCLRIFPGIDEMIAGPRIHLTGLSSAPSTLWVEKVLGFDEGNLNYGSSILTATLKSCLMLGCNPIFLAGVDLCYGLAGDKYTFGVQSIKAQDGPGLLGSCQALGLDGPVLTNYPWLAESQIISKMARNHPGISIKRCADRGLRIKGVERGSLKEFVNTGQLPRDLDNFLWNQLQVPKCDGLSWRDEFESMRASLQRCLKHFREQSSLLKTLTFDCDFNSNQLIELLNAIEFEKGAEPAFDVFFQPIAKALEHIEFDHFRFELRLSTKARASTAHKILRQQAIERLMMFEKKGNQLLMGVEEKLAL